MLLALLSLLLKAGYTRVPVRTSLPTEAVPFQSHRATFV